MTRDPYRDASSVHPPAAGELRGERFERHRYPQKVQIKGRHESADARESQAEAFGETAFAVEAGGPEGSI